jgi:hypothetical protein
MTATRSTQLWLLAVLTAVAAAWGVGTGDPAVARERNTCVNPAGADLNAVYSTDDAFITPFCDQARVGDWWRPLVRWIGAASHENVPAGYGPLAATPADDFLAKLLSVRYVVDAGSPRERSFSVDAEDLLVAKGPAPGDGEFLAYTGRLHPLASGNHTVDIYVTLSAGNWDGLGTEPENYSAAGESLISSLNFVVLTERG